jgi:hypothetical protein
VQFDVTVPTFEDKVAQRAIVMVLELVYEQDFLPCCVLQRHRERRSEWIEMCRTAA